MPTAHDDHQTFIPAVLSGLLAGRTLDEAEADAVFEHLLEGRLLDAQIGALLALVQARGATVEEVVGAARAMRRHVTPVPVPEVPGAVVIDTCGTGGAPKTFNVSTAAAIVAAAIEPPAGSGVSRILVAKHGNRSRTGRGSAEVLAALGVNVDCAPEVQSRCLAEAGVCFCFAIHHHPAMRHAAAPRRSLGFPTLFNLLGPLTNPAGASRQLIGVSRPEHVPLVAQALRRLGAERAIVMHGADDGQPGPRPGLDEFTLTGPTTYAELRGGAVHERSIAPAEIGLDEAAFDDLTVGSVEASAALVRRILAGEEAGAKRDMVLLSAAAAAVVAGVAETIAEALPLAREAITSGHADETLERLVHASQA